MERTMEKKQQEKLDSLKALVENNKKDILHTVDDKLTTVTSNITSNLTEGNQNRWR